MTSKNPWGGRFSGEMTDTVQHYTESISIDHRLAYYDIQGSIAHAKMLGETKIIPVKDVNTIVRALKQLSIDIDRGEFRFKAELEDVHMNIERALFQRIGSVAGKLHTARSRNDQVNLDMRLYIRDAIRTMIRDIIVLMKSLFAAAESTFDIIIPSYTHLQQAQPVRMSHYWLAYFWKFRRDIKRLLNTYEEVNISPLGVGAVAGVNYPINRRSIADRLSFKGITENSIDTSSDRDFIADFLHAMTLCSIHFSNLSEELIIWSSNEFGFIELSDSYTTGSSIMPNKKNSDVAELARGRSGMMIGLLTGLLATLKGLPLAYNRDLQEDKRALFTAVDTLSATIRVFSGMLTELAVNPDRITQHMTSGFMIATDLADYLVKKNVPFREAHRAIGKLVKQVYDADASLFDITLATLRKVHKAFDADALALFNYKKSVDAKISDGGTGAKPLRKQMKHAGKFLEKSNDLFSL